jgi:RNA polymerase-binding transcription factor DksA
MLTRAILDTSRRRLVALRNRLDRDQADLRDEAFRPAGDHGGADVAARPDDLGGVRLEEEITLGLLEHEERLAAAIDVALARIATNSYGHCVACGRPIAVRRLRAIPYTPYCIRCARTTEGRAAG